MDTSSMIPIEEIERTDGRNHLSLGRLADGAVEFLLGHSWCKSIERGYLALACEEFVSVFFFKIKPQYPDVDNELWVVTGDLPAAYLVTDHTTRPHHALRGYVEEMSRWIDAVEHGKPIENIIPVNVPPEKKYAEMLRWRLRAIEEWIDEINADEE